jgi:hypothetical protein
MVVAVKATGMEEAAVEAAEGARTVAVAVAVSAGKQPLASRVGSVTSF